MRLSSFGPQFGQFLTLKHFAHKLYRQQIRYVGHWSELCYIAEFDKTRGNNSDVRTTAKRAAMAFRVRFGYFEFLLTYWCS